MAGCERFDGLTVVESGNWQFFAGLCGCAADKLASAGNVAAYEVSLNCKSAGAFFLIWRDTGAELHTELFENCHGKFALAAFRALCGLLKERGVSRLTTWAENRRVRLACRIAGFRECATEPGKTYFEKLL